MVDFAGWSMPVQYTSIADEHNATRNAVGVFDISHMGRLQFRRRRASRQFLDSVAHPPRRRHEARPDSLLRSFATKQAAFSTTCSSTAATPSGLSRPCSMVVNASNREKIVAWLQTRTCPASTSSLPTTPRDTAMIAVQGPEADCSSSQQFIRPRCRLAKYALLHLRRRLLRWPRTYLVSRTGYTGEDGFEIICDAERALRHLGTNLSTPQASAAWPPASVPATRSASKPRCRSTATN